MLERYQRLSLWLIRVLIIGIFLLEIMTYEAWMPIIGSTYIPFVRVVGIAIYIGVGFHVAAIVSLLWYKVDKAIHFFLVSQSIISFLLLIILPLLYVVLGILLLGIVGRVLSLWRSATSLRRWMYVVCSLIIIGFILRSVTPPVFPFRGDHWINRNNFLIITLQILTFFLGLIPQYITVAAREEAHLAKNRASNLSHILQTKNRLSESFVHDLKTPLTAAQSFVGIIEELLKQRAISDYEQYFHRINYSLDTLFTLTQSLLELQKLDDGVMNLIYEPIPIGDFVRRLTESLESLFIEHQINLSIQIETNETVLIDSIRMQLVLTNLISNGLKYTEPGGSMWIVTTSTATHVCIVVRDNGRGISPEGLTKIFRRFEQLHPDDQKRGHGLGLSIADELVRLHHGTIDVESDVGNGSTFTVVLPKGASVIEHYHDARI